MFCARYSMFQFQYGAIIRPFTYDVHFNDESFNSSMVQLLVTEMDADDLKKTRFNSSMVQLLEVSYNQ